jgi:hypothetical protein
MSSSDQQPSIQSAKDQQLNQSTYQSPKPSPNAVEPSGFKGDDPSTAGPGPGPTNVQSNTPENGLGHINHSAPEDANTTPGTTAEK